MVTILPLGNLDISRSSRSSKWRRQNLSITKHGLANKSYHHFWIWSSFFVGKVCNFSWIGGLMVGWLRHMTGSWYYAIFKGLRAANGLTSPRAVPSEWQLRPWEDRRWRMTCDRSPRNRVLPESSERIHCQGTVCQCSPHVFDLGPRSKLITEKLGSSPMTIWIK